MSSFFGIIDLANYAYMIMAIVLMMLFAVGLILCPRKYRKAMFISALLSTPFSFASLAFDPEYWHPVRVVSYRIGPEDMLFSFATGGLAWLFAVWPLYRRIDIRLDARTIAGRYLICILYGSSFNTLFYLAGFGVMNSSLACMVLTAAFILWLRHDIWPVQVTGAAGFAVLYLVFIKTCLMVFPDSIHMWNADNLWGVTLLGMPLEEIVWACAFGIIWPLMSAYMFDVRLVCGRAK